MYSSTPHFIYCIHFFPVDKSCNLSEKQAWIIVSNYRARVTYIDYEGRSDGDSIKKIINQMKPRQLIIVHGPPEASQDLAECCRAFGGKDIKVYMPKLHETVDATSETHIYQVRVLAFEPHRNKYFLLQMRTGILEIQW